MKVKNIIASALIAVALFSCGNENSTPAPAAAPAAPATTNSTDQEVDKSMDDKPKDNSQNTASAVNPRYKYLLGSWKGNLRDKKLTVVIENIQGNIATGYNIAGNNRRPVSGTIMEDDRNLEGECGIYKLILKEPGDDKWDGFFTIYFYNCPEWDENHENVTSSYHADGEWRAFSGKLTGDVYLSK
jgi:hypothetical protein